jgi:hypothetical protein
LGLAACGNDDDDDPCPRVAGVWVIIEHCQPSAVGGTLEVQQNECSVVTNGTATEFSGTVGQNGQVTVQGSTLGIAIQCSGTATSQRVTLNCGTCQVTLERATS